MTALSTADVTERRQSWIGAPTADGVAFATWQPPKLQRPDPIAGKAIVICCDGTGNHPKQMEGDLPAATNVYLLFEALTSKSQFGTRQITWYDEGVGTGTSRASQKAGIVTRLLRAFVNWLPEGLTAYLDKFFKLFESATGAFIEENIEQGYREIVKNYEPGDSIYIFGFSRGAYTARCIAGVIGRCGLLKAENIRFVPEVMTLYRRRRSGALRPLVRQELIHDPDIVRVEVLGLWDTVASLGLPLWGWWFRVGELWRNQNLDTNPASICKHVYHAMSMDERRAQFFPTVTTPALNFDDTHAPAPDGRNQQYVQQTWFRGAHADVGGGYGNRTLGDIGLEWMLQIADFHRLSVRTDLAYLSSGPAGVAVCPKADPMGLMHDEMEGVKGWAIFGGWPRWAPVHRPYWRDRFQDACAKEYGAPHDLVYRRAEHAADLWHGRLKQLLKRSGGSTEVPLVDALMARDGLIFLDVNDAVRVRVQANRIWNRGAVVFESAAVYRITYVEGEWRDQEKSTCRAAGEKPTGLDLVRRIFRRTKREFGADWLELFGHVAHPRRWPVAEFGLFKLFMVLFWRSPKPLSKSLIRLGRHMTTPGKSVYVVNLSHGGVFYAFANDAWATYDNNSGAVTLEIQRVAEAEAGAPCYVLTRRGEVVPAVEQPEDDAEAAAHNRHMAELANLVKERSEVLAQNGAQRAWPGSGTPARPGTAAPSPASAGGSNPKTVAFSGGARSAKPATAYAHLPELERIDNAIASYLDSIQPKDETATGAGADESPPSDQFQHYANRGDAKRMRTRWSPDWGRNEA
jgi:uncharacterized protein (DUF2235 family)